MNEHILPAKQNIGAASVRAYYLSWKGWFIRTIRITCSLWNWHWKDDLIGSLLYYLNSGSCWPVRILRSARPFQMCCPCPDKCNWSLWYLVGTCWRRRTTASTAHGGDQLESNSQNQSIEAEIIGSTEVFEHPFPIIEPVGGRSAEANGVVLCYIAKLYARNRANQHLSS